MASWTSICAPYIESEFRWSMSVFRSDRSKHISLNHTLLIVVQFLNIAKIHNPLMWLSLHCGWNWETSEAQNG